MSLEFQQLYLENKDGFYIQSIEYPSLVLGVKGSHSSQQWSTKECGSQQFRGIIITNIQTQQCIRCADSPSHPGSTLHLGSEIGNTVWDVLKIGSNIALILDIIDNQGIADTNGQKVVLEVTANNQIIMQYYQLNNRKQQFRFVKYDQLKREQDAQLLIQQKTKFEQDALLLKNREQMKAVLPNSNQTQQAQDASLQLQQVKSEIVKLQQQVNAQNQLIVQTIKTEVSNTMQQVILKQNAIEKQNAELLQQITEIKNAMSQSETQNKQIAELNKTMTCSFTQSQTQLQESIQKQNKQLFENLKQQQALQQDQNFKQSLKEITSKMQNQYEKQSQIVQNVLKSVLHNKRTQ